jgi:hypothetical protein
MPNKVENAEGPGVELANLQEGVIIHDATLKWRIGNADVPSILSNFLDKLKAKTWTGRCKWSVSNTGAGPKLEAYIEVYVGTPAEAKRLHGHLTNITKALFALPLTFEGDLKFEAEISAHH